VVVDSNVQVPFAKMWSPSLVPKPKDWDDHVDVVGTFLEPVRIVNPRVPPPAADHFHFHRQHPQLQQQLQRQQQRQRDEVDVDLQRSFDPGVRRVRSEDSVLPLATPTDEYEPAPELAAFLDTTSPIVFVGFGSMVVQDLQHIVSLFLEGAALANVKILIQVGWSVISPEAFMQLAMQAQTNAALVRETERLNFGEDSVIFPSDTSHTRGATAASAIATTASSLFADMDMQDSDNDRDDYDDNSDNNNNNNGTNGGTSSSIGTWFSKLTTSVSSGFGLTQSARESATAATATGRDEASSVWKDEQYPLWTAAEDAFFMGPCPHGWLFQKVSAVVHHGGAGGQPD
jgi:hypothetical protein